MRALPLRLVLAALTSALLLVTGLAAVRAGAVTTGGTTPLPPPTGCLESFDTHPACAQLRGSSSPLSVAVTPDGRHAYAGDSGHLLAFDRNLTTGRLTQKAGATGCYGAVGGCSPLPFDLNLVDNLVVSPDGRHLYTLAANTSVARMFTIASDGSLTPGPCYGPGAGCTPVRAVQQPTDLALSPDGQYVYVASPAIGIAVLARSATTGALTQLAGPGGCYTYTGAEGCTLDSWLGGARSVATPTPTGVVVVDGTGVVASYERGVAGVLNRAGCLAVSNPGCSPSVAQLDGVATLAAVGDRVYVGTPEALVTIARGAGGTLAYRSCLGPDIGCTPVRGFQPRAGLTVSRSGSSVLAGPSLYAPTFEPGRLLAFARTGNGLAQVQGPGGCRASGTVPPGCTGTPGVGTFGGLTLSRDGRSVHVASFAGSSAAVTTLRVDTAAPSCSAGQARVRRNRPATLRLRCRDADGDPIRISIVRKPHRGKLGAVNQARDTVRYTPRRGFVGRTRFTFRATSTNGVAGAPATFRITVRR